MLTHAQTLGMEETHLEVIRNNVPAHRLFLKKGFKETDEYLVMRRAPHAAPEPVRGKATWLDREAALDILETYPQTPDLDHCTQFDAEHAGHFGVARGA